MKTNNEDLHVVPAHIEDDDLVGYLDGERDGEIQVQLQSHLESCWYCRSRLANVERSIEKFLQIRHTHLLPPEIPPAGPAIDQFRTRLAVRKALTPSHAFYRQIVPSVRTLFNRIGRALDFSDLSLNTQIFATRALAGLALVSIITGIVFVSGRFNTVTAAELLNRSIEAQTEKMQRIDGPVLHQRIHVKVANGGAETPIVWEIWNDTVNNRVRTRTGDNPSRENEVISELRTILRFNKMNDQRALSAESFKSWTDSLSSKVEEVAKENGTDGTDVFSLKTTPNVAIESNRIASAKLTIRETDYHPNALTISVSTGTGYREFELVEKDFQIVSLDSVDPAIFGDPTKVELASTVGAAPRVSPSPVESPGELANNLENNSNIKIPSASTSAEVEVLELLNKVGADTTEQVNVTRTADGHLLVEGLVETSKRKNEILLALAPVQTNPSIRIKIQTIEEATRALRQQNAQSTPGVVDRVAVDKGGMPAESELRQYFSKRGGDTDAEITQFTNRVTNKSQSAVFQASALNRMANRFSSGQIAEMGKEARAKWIRILKGYAAAVRTNTASLRDDLQPIFGGFDGGGSESITSEADLIASARRLYEMAYANDRAVRSAFTLSTGGGSTAAVRSTQFRRSVALAEALASAIERFQ